ncbi:MAG: TolC family protein [Opitutae bacterium]|nr:TolC family protein [Opitutae bacterium]
MSRPRVLAALLLLPPLLPGRAAAAPESEAPAPAWPAAPAALDALVGEAFRANLALAGEALEVERAAARLAQARSYFFPRLDLAARYSRAEGGRTIDFPVGDLLNGAYATLNQLLAAQGQPARFPPVANQSFSLLRDREQETRLRLTQPLFAPEITRSTRAARASLAAREAQLAAYRRRLRAEVVEAFFRHAQAAAAVEIFRSALGLVGESLRVSRSLTAHGRATEDTVLRAEAEVATVQQQLDEAAKDRDLARSYLNFLLNRPLPTPVPALAEAEAARYAAALAATPLPAADTARREELTALTRGQHAAHEAAAAVQARRLPTLALAVEGGIQGGSYRTGAGSDYALGSLVLEWNLFDGGQRRGELTQARLDERQAARRLAETHQQLDLQLQQAAAEFAVARTGLATAALRRDSARAAYRLVALREAAGSANQITVLDARNTLTAAELNDTITRARLCTAAARLDRAAALTPLPP